MRKKIANEYYKKLLEDYANLLILGYNKIQKEKIIENLISANLSNNKPIILVTSNNYWDANIDDENILVFSIENTNILEAIKLAMDTNRKLKKQRLYTAYYD